MSETLGSLRLLELRSRWPSESRDFTPWLAREENISLLSAALGMDLEIENVEMACGPFSADIVAREARTGAYVVIENQLEKTNHDHLGKAITYASVLGAQAIVWIAPDFTEEHKKALDWLNDNSVNEVSFFGVRPELWQIDQSRPALRFNVVSRPAEAVRLAHLQRAGSDLTETRQLKLAWWMEVRDALAASRAHPTLQTPKPRYWYDIAIGRSGFVISSTANTFDGRIGVRL